MPHHNSYLMRVRQDKGCDHMNRKSRHYRPHYYANYSPFEIHPEPTPEEINKNRLWKAPCGHWVSLIGRVKAKGGE